MIMHYWMIFVFAGCLIGSGCVTAIKPGPVNPKVEEAFPLEQWVDHIAVPYLIKELSENPRFKGKPFLLVDMERENVRTRIDGLTLDIRETLTDALLTEPGLELVWRSSTPPWEHHTTLARVLCRRNTKETYYVGIDISISPVNREMKVKIRALDIDENKWVSGFGISWNGRPSQRHKKALKRQHTDDYLIGLRPFPFNENQADLLAAYLSRNLSCLFADTDPEEAVVHVETENPDHISYFENAYNLINNYLAKYGEVMVAATSTKANITVFVQHHEIRNGLFQVWMKAKNNKNGRYIPGKETKAYVTLPVSKRERSLESIKTNPLPKSDPEEFNLCFYQPPHDFKNRIYPELKKYPGVADIQRLYHNCNLSGASICYDIWVNSEQYAKTEELVQWLDRILFALPGYYYQIQLLSDRKIRVIFSTGFD